MLEIVFAEGAAGSLAIAMGKGEYIGGVSSLVVLRDSEDAKQPDKEEELEILRQFEERERRGWEQAVPLEGSRRDILCFSLALSVGEINEDGIGEKRKAALSQLRHVYPRESEQAVRDLLGSARESLQLLQQRAGAGEPVRVWTSEMPDDACGLRWLAAQLVSLGVPDGNVTCVQLPRYLERADGTAVSFRGWGEVPPYLWGRLARSGEPLPLPCLKALAMEWKQLRSENAPLRTVISGHPVSVAEDFYDPFLLRELAGCRGAFQEARVVGAVLGKYPFGFGDGWVALRIEHMICDGLLEPVTEPEPEDPVYHRLLRRVGEEG